MASVTRLQHRRTPTTNLIPSDILAGELQFNLTDQQAFMGSAGAAAVPLLATRNFSSTASYPASAIVMQAGVMYRAKAAITPAAFTASQWDMLVKNAQPADAAGSLVNNGSGALSYVPQLPLTGGTLSGALAALGITATTFAASGAASFTSATPAAFTATPQVGGTNVLTATTGASAASVVTAQNAANAAQATASAALPQAGGTVTGSLVLSNGNLELGNPNAAGNAFLDLHTAGGGNDYDVRLIASGGTSGTSGKGALTLNLANLVVNAPITATSVFADMSAGTALTTGATAYRSLSNRFADTANVLDYGADPNNGVDSGPAFNAAFATGKMVYAPTGTYKISTTILCNRARVCLRGDGGGKTVLMNSTANTPTIVLSSNIVCATGLISGLTLDRSVTATSGGDGFRTDVSGSFTSGQVILYDILSQNNWQGFALGNSTFSFGDHLYACNNQSHGFFISNGTFNPANQWVLQNCLAQFNGGDGYYLIGITPTQNLPNPTWSATNPSYPTFGTYTYCTTFANAGNGFSIRGSSSARSSDMSLVDSFIGSDGADGLYSDAWGINNSLVNVTFELSSIYGTASYPNGIGPNQNIAAPYAGNGINITANNQDWRILNCSCNQGAYHGIATAASSTMIIGTKVFNYGLKTSNIYHGICGAVGHGTILVEGCVSGGPLGGGGSLRCGVYVQDATQVVVTGCDLRGNLYSGFYATANGAIANTSNNLGYISRNAGVLNTTTATTYTVAHGCSVAPLVVLGTPLSQLPNYWISNVTATTFQVNFASAPPNSSYFTWMATVSAYS